MTLSTRIELETITTNVHTFSPKKFHQVMKSITFFTQYRLTLALFTLLALTFTACQPEDVDNQIAEDEIELAVTEAVSEATYDDIDDIAVEAMEAEDPSPPAPGDKKNSSPAALVCRSPVIP